MKHSTFRISNDIVQKLFCMLPLPRIGCLVSIAGYSREIVVLSCASLVSLVCTILLCVCCDQWRKKRRLRQLIRQSRTTQNGKDNRQVPIYREWLDSGQGYCTLWQGYCTFSDDYCTWRHGYCNLWQGYCTKIPFSGGRLKFSCWCPTSGVTVSVTIRESAIGHKEPDYVLKLSYTIYICQSMLMRYIVICHSK